MDSSNGDFPTSTLRRAGLVRQAGSAQSGAKERKPLPAAGRAAGENGKNGHGPAAGASGRARERRQRALAETRRELVLEAARSAFLELGIEQASIREIARRAGYTPGAIYSYFASKEALYGALLEESLDRLNAAVQAAVNEAGGPADDVPPGTGRVEAAASAFFAFYRDNPRDLDLGFYLFQGIRPRGLTPALNRALNRRLHDALRPTQEGLQALGLSADRALRETTALFAHIVGVLVLGHTGRIRMFGQTPDALFQAYLADLIGRSGTPRP